MTLVRLALVLLVAVPLFVACGKKKPAVVDAGAEEPAPSDAGNASTGATTVGDSGPAPAAVVEDIPGPLEIGGWNIPQPRDFRRATKGDAIGTPEIGPMMARGDVVLVDGAAFPPGIISVGFIPSATLPKQLDKDACAEVAKTAAGPELVGEPSVTETSLGPTCFYETKTASGATHVAYALLDGRALGITAIHTAQDTKTVEAWDSIAKGMRKKNP